MADLLELTDAPQFKLTGIDLDLESIKNVKVLDSVNMQDTLLQKIIFADLLKCKWQVFRSEDAVKTQLQKAEFTDIETIYDIAHIFLNIARRPLL